MCGICGIFEPESTRVVQRSTLKAMADTLHHRGPDDEGFYSCGPVGLAHRRLSIIDLEGGHQPLSNEDGSVWIVFNGEIYNFAELNRQFLSAGHSFRTRSDTETIVHLYEELGEACFAELRGMFSLALWDARKQRLILARDRVGKKPLFYSWDGRRLRHRLFDLRRWARGRHDHEHQLSRHRPFTRHRLSLLGGGDRRRGIVGADQCHHGAHHARAAAGR